MLPTRTMLAFHAGIHGQFAGAAVHSKRLWGVHPGRGVLAELAAPRRDRGRTKSPQPPDCSSIWGHGGEEASR